MPSNLQYSGTYIYDNWGLTAYVSHKYMFSEKNTTGAEIKINMFMLNCFD